MARRSESERSGPVRTCVGCRTRAAKHELLRVTADFGEDGASVVLPDPSGTALGRGAHLHPTPECYDLAVRRKAFSRALGLAGGSSSAPVGEYVATLTQDRPTDRSPDRPTQNRSNGS